MTINLKQSKILKQQLIWNRGTRSQLLTIYTPWIQPHYVHAYNPSRYVLCKHYLLSSRTKERGQLLFLARICSSPQFVKGYWLGRKCEKVVYSYNICKLRVRHFNKRKSWKTHVNSFFFFWWNTLGDSTSGHYKFIILMLYLLLM